MIPREILKKIRQIELRTNRIVTEWLAGVGTRRPGLLTAKYAKYAKREIFFVFFFRVFRVVRGSNPFLNYEH
ncbi:MAG: hypothetical protein RLY20_686 [Verrucomicrobiota bacterium]|jgi:hypothetical protein